MPYRSHYSDHSYQASLFKFRAIVAAIICLLMLAGLLFRLAWLQIVDYKHFADLSENNRIRLMALPPTRGLIYDRNGVVLAENKPTFHLEIVPEQVDDMDATLQGLSEIVVISESQIEHFKEQLRARRSFQRISLRSRLNEDEVARLAVNRHRFPGMDINARLSRHYPQGEAAAHAVGYVGRINKKELTVIDEGNYRGTTHIGKTGLEKYYEAELHGQVGRQRVEVNAQGRVLRVIDKVAPVAGNDLTLNLDIELQNIAVNELGEFAGAVIAIEPHTGAVVVFVSKPGFDPNLFVHGISHKNYNALSHGIYKPLFNRAIFGQYPPGSTFKPFIALAGVEQRRFGVKETLYCRGHYLLPGDKTERKYRDWKKEGHGTVDLDKAIEQSCDVYFYELAYRMGIDSMHEFLAQFGFGKKTGIDLLGERRGLLPSTDWKKKKKQTVWYPGETLIAGIGQGYMLTTPIQLAVATAALASRGEMIVPRLLKEVHESGDGAIREREPSKTMIKLRRENHWDVMFKAMQKVVHGTWGTARATGWGMKFKMAGKTGTAQVFGIAQDEEYDEETVAKKLRDHGLFIGFGPAEDPVLAVAVVAENGEHGSKMAPIARKLIQRYMEKYTAVTSRHKASSKEVISGLNDGAAHTAHNSHNH
ncbi:MAG: penicillin-binding protein 2 [Gammaproteobacteria bacterium]|nr:MAG: penicillin-binding protein 2 [Gammaproteobacteria bacterium]